MTRFSQIIVPGPRDNIEDKLGIARLLLPIPNVCATVAVMADGVGGEHGGEVASQITVKMLLRRILSALALYSDAPNTRDLAPDTITTILLDAMLGANDAVLRRTVKDRHLKNMATTAVCAVAIADQLHIAWVGDSRAYVHTEGQLQRLTSDHSVTQRLIDTGQLARQAAASHPSAHRILRYVGQTEGFEPELTMCPLSAGDIVLLCTDGLTDVVGDNQIGQTLELVRYGHLGTDDAARRLVRTALSAQTTDNTSVLLFEPIPGAQGLDRTRTGAFPTAIYEFCPAYSQGA